MSVTLPPTPPDPSDPTTFDALAAAFVAWFPTLVDDLNVYSGMTNSGSFTDGTASAPGIRYASDTNTGLFRPAADQIGMATGGVQRALLSSSAMQIDVPITGTAVVSSATDTTSGRLLTVGSHGIGLTGSAGNVTDIDVTTIAAGLRRYSSGSSGTFPSGVIAAAGGVILIIRETATKATMLLSPGGTNDTFIRSLNTTWGPWSKLMMVDASVAPTAGQILRQNDANTALIFANAIGGSAVVNAATGSPTSIDFTGVPAYARELILTFSGLSTNGGSSFQLRGGSGSFETTGYYSVGEQFNSGSTVRTPISLTGGYLVGSTNAPGAAAGVARLCRIDPAANTWVLDFTEHTYDGTSFTTSYGTGTKTFSGQIDRIRLTTVNGSDTFDGGIVSIMWS